MQRWLCVIVLSMTYPPRHVSARNEFRQQAGLRIQASQTLSGKFTTLKSLKVSVTFFSGKGVAKSREMKCQYNLDSAKSVFRFDCPNCECVGGDFELTDVLAAAVVQRRTTVTGELSCKGWRDKDVINTIHCDNKMRYKMSLSYTLVGVSRAAAITQPSMQALAT